MSVRRNGSIAKILRIVAAVLITLFVLTDKMTSNVINAAGGSVCSLTLTIASSDGEHEKAEGCEVLLFEIASATVNGSDISYSLKGDFTSSGIDLKLPDEDLADAAYKYISSNDLTKNGAAAVSGPDGIIVYKNLECGIYLVVNSRPAEGFAEFVPFICHLPAADGTGSFLYDVNAEPKTVYKPPVPPATTDITVRKVWNDDGSKRPDKIVISLNNENGTYAEQELTGTDNWTYTWTGLDPALKWSVEEKNVPEGYSVTYSSETGEGVITFTVTNTAKLIQTGQNEKEIAILFFAGILLISAGIIIRIVGRRADEEQA